MQIINTVLAPVDKKSACAALSFPRCSYYRSMNQSQRNIGNNRPKSHRALDDNEQKTIMNILHSERFIDRAPAEIYSTLLDENQYHCSVRTMYRLLEKYGEIKERRKQRNLKNYKKPELMATAQNQVWSWDITKLKTTVKWSYFYLYVILDIFSRYVVGWMIGNRESSELAKKLIEETIEKQNIGENQLTIHSDRGSSMKSKTIAQLLADLSITKSHSRPSVSNDNPFSEAQFKTVKYNPWFPDKFGSMEDALGFCRYFFNWYNNEHHHSGISFLTPHMVHYGDAADILKKRHNVLKGVYEKHPERFVNFPPKCFKISDKVWINPPVIIKKEVIT